MKKPLIFTLITAVFTLVGTARADVDLGPIAKALAKAEMCAVTASRPRGIRVENANTEWVMTCLDAKKNRVIEKKTVARDDFPQDGSAPKDFGYLELMVDMKNRGFTLAFFHADFGMVFNKQP